MNNIIADNIAKDIENKNKVRRLRKRYRSVLCVGCSAKWFAKHYRYAESAEIVFVTRIYRGFDLPYHNFELIYVYDINLVEDPLLLYEAVSDKSDLLLENVFISPEETLIIGNKHLNYEIPSGMLRKAGVFADKNSQPYVFSPMNNRGHVLECPYYYYYYGDYSIAFSFAEFPNFNAFDDTMPFDICLITCEAASYGILAQKTVTAADLKFTNTFYLDFHIESRTILEFKVYSYGVAPFGITAEVTVSRKTALEYNKHSFPVNADVNRYEKVFRRNSDIFLYDPYGMALGGDLVDMSVDDEKFSNKVSFIASKFDEKDAAYFRYIIKRLIKDSKTFNIDRTDMTDDEIKDFMDIKTGFYDIVRKQDDNYVFKGYTFPSWDITPAIFFNFGMDFIDKEYISGKSAIDAGAYFGDSSLVFTQYGLKTVYAFEPESSNYDLLLKTIAMNNAADKIIPVKKGIGAVSETRSIKFNMGASTIVDKVDASDDMEKIEIVSIDDFAEMNNLQVGLIKSDTEGFERYLIAGAEKTVRKDRPVLIISIYHSAEDLLNLIPQILEIEPSYKLKLAKLEPASIIIDTVAVFY